MKVGVGSFSLTQLATVVVPGAITCAAVAFLMGPIRLQAGLTRLQEVTPPWAGWLVPFALLLAVILLGMVIASLNGVWEAEILDRAASRRLNIRKGIYDHQWYAYLAALPKHNNRYIAKLVDFFQFELRTAWSLILLTIGVTLRYKLDYGAPFMLLFAAYVMYRLGTTGHFELARYRHQMYRLHKGAADCDLTPDPDLASWNGSVWSGSMWDLLKLLAQRMGGKAARGTKPSSTKTGGS